MRDETCCTRLKEAGEMVSDRKLIFMLMKHRYKAFTTVVFQQDIEKFSIADTVEIAFGFFLRMTVRRKK